MSLSCEVFHFYVLSALQLLSLYFYVWLIRAVASSYVHQQHFRSRSLASSVHFYFGGRCFLDLLITVIFFVTFGNFTLRANFAIA